MNGKIGEVSLFGKCLLVSAAAHTTLLMLLLSQPVWLQRVIGQMPTHGPMRGLALSYEDDATFDLFLRKSPARKPFDQPLEETSSQPSSEAAHFQTVSIPLSLPTVQRWITSNFPNFSIDELEAEATKATTYAAMEIPVSEIANPGQPSGSHFLVAIASTLSEEDQRGEKSSLAARQTQEEVPQASNTFQITEWTAIAKQPQYESNDLTLPLTPPPEYEACELPAIVKPLSIEKESPHEALCFTPPDMPIEENPDPSSVVVHPDLELPSDYISTPFALVEPAAAFSKNYTLEKPLLSTPPAPAQEMLGAVPNFTFGNDRTPSSIRNFDLPDIASVAEWHNLFTIEVHAAPRKDEDELVFSIELTPKKEAMAYALKQNFHFIIDCSPKVPKQRVPAYKEAVQRALEYLGPKQAFNIYILQEKGVIFADEPVAGTEVQCAKAHAFLNREKYKELRHRLDLIDVLNKIAALPKSQDELHTIILLSDGNIARGREGKKDELYTWLWQHRGKIALYAAAIGEKKPNLDLQLFASASGGRVLMSPTYAGFPRRFAKLVMDLKHPLAKDVSVALLSKQTQQPLALATPNAILPPLFAGQSYTIVGTAPAATDFTFLLEGVSKGRYVEISKHLTLKNAAKPTSGLNSLWSKKKAQEDLVQYLNHREKSDIEEAVKLLVQSEEK